MLATRGGGGTKHSKILRAAAAANICAFGTIKSLLGDKLAQFGQIFLYLIGKTAVFLHGNGADGDPDLKVFVEGVNHLRGVHVTILAGLIDRYGATGKLKGPGA